MKQKSIIKWLREGDQNTSFFHHHVQSKQSREQISSLVCLDGTLTKNEGEVCQEILSVYKDLLGTSDHSCTGGSPSMLKPLLTSSLPSELSAQFIQDVIDEEIFHVIKSMPKNKAPGPDGYTTKFFIASWGVISSSVISAIKEFFRSGQLLR